MTENPARAADEILRGIVQDGCSPNLVPKARCRQVAARILSPDLLWTRKGSENPQSEPCGHISGTHHPRLSNLSFYLRRPEPGSVTLPSTIPVVNCEAMNPLQRSAVRGVDLTLQSPEHSTHVLVLAFTGSGKNQRVIDPLSTAGADEAAT